MYRHQSQNLSYQFVDFLFAPYSSPMVFRPLSIAALAATALSALAVTPALGQTPSNPPATTTPAAQQQPQSYTLVHVNATSGNDGSGDGSQLRPFRTISHALEVATPNSIVVLAPGEYSDASGEDFPLMLRPGVTVQGAVTPGVGNVVVRGSGIYPSSTGALLQVTVVGVDGAGLGHVTLTNPSSSGYGLVVETGSPVIRQNRFVGSGYAGAFVTGTAAPLFEQNVFTQNGSVGLVIGGQSRAEVVGNVFENTGTGIQVAPGAEPYISNNRISSNREGIVLAANAQPRLQNNEISRNRQNGLVEFASATKTETEAWPATALAAPMPLMARQETPGTPLGTQPMTPGEADPEQRPLATAATPAPPVQPLAASVAPTGREQPLTTASAAPEPQEPTLHSPALPLSLPLATALHSPNPAEVAAAGEEESNYPAATASANPGPTATGPEAEEPVAVEAAPAATEPDNPREGVSTFAATAGPTAELVETASTPGESGVMREAPGATATDHPESVEVRSSPEEPDATAALTTLENSGPGEARTSSEEPASTTARATPVTSAPIAVEERTREETAVPLQVIPPAVETLARAEGGPSGVVPRPMEVSASPDHAELERIASLPPLPEVDPSSETLLPVPEGNIPTGTGSQSISLVATSPNQGGQNGGAPPAPPSRASMLGLLYRVLVPNSGDDVQARVREWVPDAFRVEFENQPMMQAGAYSTQTEAEAMAERLQRQGLDARVVYIP